MLATKGEKATEDWLAGLKTNGTVYDGNNVVLESVNSGEKPAGVIYHYYWYRDQEESGENSDSTQLQFFGDKDPGAFVSVSGGGVLKSSAVAARPSSWSTYLAGARVSRSWRQVRLEYTVGAGVRPTPRSSPSPSCGRHRWTSTRSTDRRSSR